MPRTRNPPIGSNDAVLQRRPIMSTFMAQGMILAVILDDEDLGVLDALDLGLDLVEVLEVRQGGDVFEFVFLRHGGL